MAQADRVNSRLRETVRKLVTDVFGSRPNHIQHEPSGLSNSVFSVEHGGRAFIVRVNPAPEKLGAFLKEQWATARAGEAGVPVPEILKVGSDPVPHMLLRKSAGEPATSHPDRLRILRDLGRYAAQVNSIRTAGFGTSFDWADEASANRPDWHTFLLTELKLEQRLRILRRRRMLPEARLAKIKRTLENACGRGRKPALNHGDLRLKNVVVDNKGSISAILDWEDCISSLAPEWELSLALHDLTIDEKHEFLRGYGMRPKDVPAIAPIMKALNIINYAGEVEQLSKANDKEELEFCRTRLSGALDLYCLGT
jgi:hygromycin-B 4-O-kinase